MGHLQHFFGKKTNAWQMPRGGGGEMHGWNWLSHKRNKEKRDYPHKLNDFRGMVTLQFAICQVTLRQLETFGVIWHCVIGIFAFKKKKKKKQAAGCRTGSKTGSGAWSFVQWVGGWGAGALMWCDTFLNCILINPWNCCSTQHWVLQCWSGKLHMGHRYM